MLDGSFDFQLLLSRGEGFLISRVLSGLNVGVNHVVRLSLKGLTILETQLQVLVTSFYFGDSGSSDNNEHCYCNPKHQLLLLHNKMDNRL